MTKEHFFEDLPRAEQDALLEFCKQQGMPVPSKVKEVELLKELDELRQRLVDSLPHLTEAMKCGKDWSTYHPSTLSLTRAAMLALISTLSEMVVLLAALESTHGDR